MESFLSLYSTKQIHFTSAETNNISPQKEYNRDGSLTRVMTEISKVFYLVFSSGTPSWYCGELYPYYFFK